jgi:lactosylceramide 4-alpha-galactosyltransferase
MLPARKSIVLIKKRFISIQKQRCVLILLVVAINIICLWKYFTSSCVKDIFPLTNELYLEEMTSVLNQRDFSREAIYFTETTGTGIIKPRFVCAVESAARLHPRADVYLLVVYAPRRSLSLNENNALFTVLQYHTNIYVLYVDMQKLVANTPLEAFYYSGKLQTSKYLAEHTSDVVRFLSVWKYGGKYFDLDFILAKSFEGYHYFIIHESSFILPNIASGMFAFEKNCTLGKIVLNIIANDFNGTERGHNGPWAFTRAMMQYCNSLVPLMTPEKCHGFQILKYETMFPLEFNELGLYFDEENSQATMNRLRSVKDLAGFHVGNNLVKGWTVKPVETSKQPLAIIARDYCPRSFWSCKYDF